MPVRIRLVRKGTRSKPMYRVVVADGRSPRSGRTLEIIGYYHPRAHPPVFQVDSEKVQSWLARGAVPTEPVRKWLGTLSILPPLDFSSKPKRPSKSTKEEVPSA